MHFTSSLPGVNDNPCGVGWTYSSVSGKCYKFIDSKKSWSESNTECGSVAYAYPDKTALAKTQDFYNMISVTRAAGFNREIQWVGGKLKEGEEELTKVFVFFDEKSMSAAIGLTNFYTFALIK